MTENNYASASARDWTSNLSIDWEILNTDFVRQAMSATVIARKSGQSVRMCAWTGNFIPEIDKKDWRSELEKGPVELANSMKLTRFTRALTPPPKVDQASFRISHEGWYDDNRFFSVSNNSGYITIVYLGIVDDDVIVPLEVWNMDTWAKAKLTDKAPTGSIYMLMAGPQGPEFREAGKGGESLVRENYTPEVVAAFDRICGELATAEPRGRLSVISGPAGTGKTYLVRALLQEVPSAIFTIVPQSALPMLMEPTGLTSLYDFRNDHKDNPIVLILEDADDALAPREDSSMNIISALLNMSDGITGKVLDVRIVATTNREQQSFDPAIMRPGRLSTATVVGKLSAEQAAKVYCRLLNIDSPDIYFDEPLSLSEIYQKAYDKGWMPAANKKSRRMGFGS
jgi:hypothetical protein